MKPPILLAALLLLPASVATAGHPPVGVPAGPGSNPQAPGRGSFRPGGQYGTAVDTRYGAPPDAASVPAGITTAAGGAGAAPSWRWPLAPRPPVLRSFDPPPKPWLSGHRGVDLGAGGDGAPVTSPTGGTVSFVGVVVDRPVITIDHGGGLRSSFEPVDSVLVAGSVVAAGQVVGTVRTGHCPGTTCVHWGVRDGDGYVDPLQFVMDLRPSVLLPLSGAS